MELVIIVHASLQELQQPHQETGQMSFGLNRKTTVDDHKTDLLDHMFGDGIFLSFFFLADNSCQITSVDY